MAAVDFFGDPRCPWAWLTAQWLVEIEKVRDVTATFHVMSLTLLNESRGSALTADPIQTWGPLRVLMATGLTVGQPALRELYLTLSALIHRDKVRLIDREHFALALHRAGLPYSLGYAAESTHYDEAIRESHRSRVEPGSETLGSPTLRIHRESGGSVAFLGPVITPCPRGEAAGRLWDSVVLAANTDSFFEFTRVRTREPIFD